MPMYAMRCALGFQLLTVVAVLMCLGVRSIPDLPEFVLWQGTLTDPASGRVICDVEGWEDRRSSWVQKRFVYKDRLSGGLLQRWRRAEGSKVQNVTAMNIVDFATQTESFNTTEGVKMVTRVASRHQNNTDVCVGSLSDDGGQVVWRNVYLKEGGSIEDVLESMKRRKLFEFGRVRRSKGMAREVWSTAEVRTDGRPRSGLGRFARGPGLPKSLVKYSRYGECPSWCGSQMCLLEMTGRECDEKVWRSAQTNATLAGKPTYQDKEKAQAAVEGTLRWLLSSFRISV